MKCPELERVSTWVDDELTVEENIRLVRHMETCSECRHAAEEFRALRRRLKDRSCPPEPQTQARVLASLLDGRARAVWHHPLRVSAQAAAAVLIMALSFWAGSVRVRGTPALIAKPAPPGSVRLDDLSRFDSGHRARLYKEPRR